MINQPHTLLESLAIVTIMSMFSASSENDISVDLKCPSTHKMV